MAIKIRANLHPYGYAARPQRLLEISIHSDDVRPMHLYRITFDNQEIDGEIAKTKSGHRNLLHVLKDILDDVDLDALGVDYIETPVA